MATAALQNRFESASAIAGASVDMPMSSVGAE